MLNEIFKLLILIIIGVSIGFLIKMVIDPYLQQSEQSQKDYKTYKIFSNAFIQKQKQLKEQQMRSQQQEQEEISEKTQSPMKNEEESINSIKQIDGAQNKIQSSPVKSAESSRKGETLQQEPAQIETVEISGTPISGSEIYLKEEISSQIVLNPVMPKQSQFTNELRDFILSLYNMQKKESEYSNAEYNNISGLADSKVRRTDSNSFYAALVSKYFSILLNQYDDTQLKAQLNKIKQMNFQIFYQDLTLPGRMSKQLSLNLINYLLKLREKDNKNQELDRVMQDLNQEFYGLSIIYIRNLIHQLIQNEVKIENDCKNQILNWETDYQNNELINNILATELDVTINIHSNSREFGEPSIANYGNNKQHQINITYEKGHYSIANPLISQK